MFFGDDEATKITTTKAEGLASESENEVAISRMARILIIDGTPSTDAAFLYPLTPQYPLCSRREYIFTMESRLRLSERSESSLTLPNVSKLEP